MKKLIAAVVLATSFAAFADDAAKTTDAKKTEKKTTEKKSTETTKTEKPAAAPAAEKAPEKK